VGRGQNTPLGGQGICFSVCLKQIFQGKNICGVQKIEGTAPNAACHGYGSVLNTLKLSVLKLILVPIFSYGHEF